MTVSAPPADEAQPEELGPAGLAVRRATVVLVSGDAADATASARAAFPGASISTLHFDDVRGGSKAGALRRLRRGRPDVLVLFGSGLVDRGERPLYVLATWVAGATRICLMEPSGRSRMRPLRGLRARTLARVALEPPAGAVAMTVLAGAARALARRASRRSLPHLERTANLRVVYLRSELPYELPVGGSASHTVGMVRALAELGHRVNVITAPPPPDFNHPDVDVTIVPYARTIFELLPFRVVEIHLRFLLRAWRLVREGPPDLFLARHRRFDPSAAVLALLTRRPLALQHEGSEELVADHYDPTSFMGTLRAYERLNHEVAGAILAVSEEVVQDLVERRGVAADRLDVAQAAVDTSRFRPGVGGVERRRELGVADGTPVVGFCGSFGPWHGVETLVEALATLPAEPRLHCLLVGDGPSKPALRAILDDPSFAHDSTLTGLVPLAGMPSYLDACDILACPTRLMPGQEEFFGSPTKLFEYLATGKAVVASALGQIPEVVHDGDNGLLVPEGDVRALADAILRLARDPELRARLGAAARAGMVEHGGWERNVRMALERLAGTAAG